MRRKQKVSSKIIDKQRKKMVKWYNIISTGVMQTIQKQMCCRTCCWDAAINAASAIFVVYNSCSILNKNILNYLLC